MNNKIPRRSCNYFKDNSYYEIIETYFGFVKHCYHKNTYQIERYNKKGKLFSIDDNPSIEYYENDNLIIEEWYREGIYWRENYNPTYIEYNSNGTVNKNYYYYGSTSYSEQEVKKLRKASFRKKVLKNIKNGIQKNRYGN